MNESPANASVDMPFSAYDLTVVTQDGRRSVVQEGEFRSEDGKLLFVRNGAQIEIRCPRSKELYILKWDYAPSGDPGIAASPEISSAN